MRFFSWLLRQVRYDTLVPVGQTGLEPLSPDSLWRSSVDDCEAFLTGRLAEYRMDHEQFVSVSDWTNLLAHGSEDDLRHEISGAGGSRPRAHKAGCIAEWRAARLYLAATLLHRAADEATLRRIQQQVLVPLELKLATGGVDWSAGQWAKEVDAALDPHLWRYPYRETQE